MPASVRPGDELAGRYRIEDLLDERRGGRFFRAWDKVLTRHVAVHVIATDDERADGLREAAKRSVGCHDPRVLRVLDVDDADRVCFVVNEWGSGRSLDIVLADEGPLAPRRAAWVVCEVADCLAQAHEAGVTHGRVVPENVLIDVHGGIRIIGLAVDAALHGMPPGRRSADVTDLVGVLYAALTGRWAGVSQSSLPPAHLDGNRVLRPRQVRAGIPRMLDQLCDDVLNGSHDRSEHDLTTARGVHDALLEFLGDTSGMASAEAARAVATPLPAPVPGADLPPEPTPPAPGPAGDQPTRVVEAAPSAPERSPEPAPAPRDPTDVPTQAGLPVFDDENDDVGWVARERETPPPPPRLEEPEPKPLFAPEPADGRPVRTPRQTAAAGTAGAAGAAATRAPAEPRRWESTGPGVHTGTGAGTGSGVLPVYVDDEVPGRSWLRLAWVIGAATLLLLAVVFAFDLGSGRRLVLGENDPSPSGDPSAGQSARPQVLTGLTVTDLDPQGDPPYEENRDLVGLTVDGDPATAWRTMTYNDPFGPGGLKTGVGLVVDMGEVRAARRVDVTFPEGGETSFTLYLSNEQPRFVRDLEPIASESGTGTVAVELDGSERGRYLTVWLTGIPQTAEGGYRGEVAEIRVTA